MEQMVRRKKRIHLEVLRIAACFFVIFNHTSSEGFFLFSQYSVNDPRYWLYSFASVFCKFSVPLFFAISGALLLPKNESIKEVYRKRVLRIVLVLIIASLMYYIYNSRYDLGSLSLRAFLLEIYTVSSSYHLWYLYAFIPFLMALPHLRPMAQSLNNKHFLYIVVCCLAFLMLPVAEYFIWQGEYSLNGNFQMSWLLSNAVVFPFVGYYLENRMDVECARKYIPYLWIVNIITIMISCFATYYRARVTGVCSEGESQVFHTIIQ